MVEGLKRASLFSVKEGIEVFTLSVPSSHKLWWLVGGVFGVVLQFGGGWCFVVVVVVEVFCWWWLEFCVGWCFVLKVVSVLW